MVIEAYTDGACKGNPGPGGWAAIILMPTEIIKKSGYELDTTNNRMELLAAIHALNNIKKMLRIECKRVHIYSDSAYVVNAMQNGWIKKWMERNWKTAKNEDVKNVDIWQRMHDIHLELKNKKIDVRFIKVKGHAGDIYNEMADNAAKSEVLKALSK